MQKKDKETILIVGGGYTGLSAAINLIDRGFNVRLIEKSNFLGGLGGTLDLTNQYKCETYYHHFFIKDKYLINFCKRFLKSEPTFIQTNMAIFYKNKFHSWNNIKDFINYPYINIFQKIRFLISTFLISNSLLSKFFLQNQSLDKGMKKLYGNITYMRIWEPIIRGKFGDKVNVIPLEWMAGRLKQRIESRKGGREKLGYLKGSLKVLTDEIESYIAQSEGSRIYKNTILKRIDKVENQNYLECESETNEKGINKKHIIKVDKVIFTLPTDLVYKIKINVNKQILWKKHKYFTAYCILLELSESLSDFYWTNIADKDIFFCGYIEQTKLTGTSEYGGLHIGYLTKYLDNSHSNVLSRKEIIDHVYKTLNKLFPNKNLQLILKKIHISISKYAQPITELNFKHVESLIHAKENLYIGNMSNLYPKERSINNAIEIGDDLIRKIY